VLGITGGIGMGKSACAELLMARGIRVIDTDALARDLVQPGQAALLEISQSFGSGVLNSAGGLDRHTMAGIVFRSPDARRELESILHPRIREAWKFTMQEWRRIGQTPIAAVIIPLLFETGAQQDVDATVCVACSEVTQLERLASRKWSPTEIRDRIAAQMPAVRKIELSDYVIWSEGSLELHGRQLDRILDAQ